jgi:hypothetical protein
VVRVTQVSSAEDISDGPVGEDGQESEQHPEQGDLLRRDRLGGPLHEDEVAAPNDAERDEREQNSATHPATIG